jgi:O-antigen ligase
MTLPKFFGLIFFAFYFVHSGVLLRKPLPPIPVPVWWFIGYFLVYAITGLFVSDDGLIRYISRMLKLAQLFVLLWLASALLKNFELATKCLMALAFSCVFLATGTLLGLPGFAGTAGGRVTTLEFSPNTIASLMAYSALILIGLCLTERRLSVTSRCLIFVSTFPLFWLIVSSGSRAAIGSLVIGLLMFFAPQRGSRRQVAAFFVGVAALAGILFVLQSSSALERWDRTMNEGEVAGRDESDCASASKRHGKHGWVVSAFCL